MLPAARLPGRPAFPGHRAIGRIEAERRLGTLIVASVLYVALSKAVAPKRLAEIVCARWSIENQLHRALDVVFREDDARTRKDHVPQNLAVIRRIANNILSVHPLQKPIASKMRRADWGIELLFELFIHML